MGKGERRGGGKRREGYKGEMETEGRGGEESLEWRVGKKGRIEMRKKVRDGVERREEKGGEGGWEREGKGSSEGGVG